MKIIFKTQNLNKIAKKEADTEKFALILLQNFYIHLKNELINNIKHRKEIFFNKFELELVIILKTIYSLFIANYSSYSLLKNFAIQSFKKNDNQDLINEKLQQIIDAVDNDINLQKNNFFDNLATKQALIILSNIKDKVGYLYNKATESTYQELQNIESQLLEIQNELYEINLLSETLQTNKTKAQLEVKQKEYQNRKLKYRDLTLMSLLAFSDLYDSQITNNRAISQAENEVSLVSSRYMALEATALSNVVQANPNVNKSSISEFTKWNGSRFK